MTGWYVAAAGWVTTVAGLVALYGPVPLVPAGGVTVGVGLLVDFDKPRGR